MSTQSTAAPTTRDRGTDAGDQVVTAVEQALGVIVRHVNLPRTWQRVFDEAGIDPEHADRSKYPLLGRIERHGPIRPSDLAAQLGVKISTISRQVAELERQGLVEREVCPHDGRAFTLVLTDEGSALLWRLRDVRHRRMAAHLAGWPRHDREQLARLLTRLAVEIAPDLCDPPTEPRP